MTAHIAILLAALCSHHTGIHNLWCKEHIERCAKEKRQAAYSRYYRREERLQQCTNSKSGWHAPLENIPVLYTYELGHMDLNFEVADYKYMPCVNQFNDDEPILKSDRSIEYYMSCKGAFR